MIVGIDIGYGYTKTCANDHQAIFPSVVGSYARSRFALTPDDYIVLSRENDKVLVGQGAVEQSRFRHRLEDRNWIHSDEYMTLFHAALTESTKATRCDVSLVTGLPIAFYDDKDSLRVRLAKEHRIRREGFRSQVFNVGGCRVLPQPYGTLCSLAIDESGNVVDGGLLKSRVGIVDAGSHTTNILSTLKAGDIEKETGSVNMGAWDVVRAVRDALEPVCRDLDLPDHDLADAIIARQVPYYGRRVNITEIVEAALAPFASQVIAVCGQLWDGGARLDTILITGGGAKLIGDVVKRHFYRHQDVRIVQEPVFANCRGYLRLGRYLEKEGEW
jgi:plasmid segregation protein ParM